ncbi:CPBP family intramembrane glutamic endopeptidase [Halobium salinum]|uniref:CPBP family intramembrane glutamic endopeptidase n=1 Tax=Halobium salinum TaxID=1364940 RepID=A0ABD5P6M5_9EURY|nr:type II CAAX endopeptidase family protein [Halobium salinum]
MSHRRLVFRGGLRTLLGFGAALGVWIPATLWLEAAAAGYAAWVVLSVHVATFAALAGLTLLVLRFEGIRVTAVGLSRRHLRPALVAFVGVWVGVNVVGLCVAAATGARWGVDLLGATVDPRWQPLPAPWVTTLLVEFLVVGVVEEFAFRGYFQTKTVALLGDDSRLRIALGVVTASLLFGALHTPGALVAGASLGGVLGAALLPTLTGLVFGTFYELTHNVYFVALLHGLGNTWPLVVDWSTWSTPAVAAFFVGVAVVYVAATAAYRYRTVGTARTPLVERKEGETADAVD